MLLYIFEANASRDAREKKKDKMKISGLGIGRDVHYVNQFGIHCAAKIVSVRNEERGDSDLVIWAPRTDTIWDSRVDNAYERFVPFSSDTTKFKTWHFPEKL